MASQQTSAKRDIQKSANARLNQIKKANYRISELASLIKIDGVDGEKMQEMRDTAENLLQCVHEYNAYSNAVRKF